MAEKKSYKSHGSLDDIDVNDVEASIEKNAIASPLKNIYDDSQAQAIDNKLKDHLENLSVDRDDLPMDMSNFYEKQ